MTEEQQRIQAFIKGEAPQISPDDATPSSTPTDEQLADALAFATSATELNGKLGDKVILSIIRRFQLPETEVVWLKTTLAASVEDRKGSIEFIPAEESNSDIPF